MAGFLAALTPALLAKFGLAGLGGLAGAFPNKKTTEFDKSGQSQTATNQNTQSIEQLISSILSQSQSGGTTSSIGSQDYNSPAAKALQEKLISQYSNLQNPDLKGYEAQGITQINRNSDLQAKAVQNALAARGLAGSPVAGVTDAGLQSDRISGITQFQQGLPILQNQLALQNAGAAGGFLSSIPRITTQFGETTGFQNTNQQGNQTQVGNTSSTGVSNTTTSEQGKGTENSGGGAGGFFGGLGAILASLFGGGKK